ncbi:MAG: HlyD family efflux transporter periplasmic adaptor subunit [Planctomycetota bacterium]|nr:MAG: HlyD family efflux transporter periplasmic adaptor subunit [Planctomycetota bacterium]
MRRKVLSIVLLAAAGVAAGLTWWLTHRESATQALALYGNVDLRQVELPFNNSERIAAVLVQEGDRVRQGQVLARLDTSRLEPQVAQAEAQAAAQRHIVERLQHGSRPEEIAQAEAQAAAQRHVVERLQHGSRPEEIAQARANVESAKADVTNARRQYERLKTLLERSAGAVSQQDVDNAKAALDVAEARLAVNQKALELAVAGPRQEEVAENEAKLAVTQKALDLAVAGPRQEEVAEAEARLRAAEAQLALLRQQLADAQLVAPVDAVVRTRLLEPGEMASPQKPVFALAITDPKWVRAYVSERDLGKVHPSMAASVAVDSFPDRRFTGWVGFVSPVAEFTPKAVQTAELRTSLVYEIRVFVKDPSDELRLGMPATVYLPLDQHSPQAPTAPVAEGQR